LAVDDVGINPDLGNLVRVGWPLAESWEDTLRGVAEAMNYWHVKNWHRIALESGPFASTPSTLPEGVIDYRRAMDIARAAGFTGAVVIEHYGGDVTWFARQARDYLNGLLDR
jgi:sugar phosphate isomerase/epimerase